MVKIVEQVSAPKRKRYNKNKKKAWKKKVDISNVEEYMEDERRQERYGGPLEERKDDELMFLDVGGTSKAPGKNDVASMTYTVDAIPKDSPTKKVKETILKQSKRNRAVKVLKSHQFIHGLQGAKPPHKPRPDKGTITVAMKKKAMLREKDPRYTKRAERSLKDFKQHIKKKHANSKSMMQNKYDFNLWDEKNNDIIKECRKKGAEESFMKGISKYHKVITKVCPIQVPRHRFIRTSTLDAVQVPVSGQSYNPSYTAHQKLLRQAMKQQESRNREEKRIDITLKKHFPTADKAPTEETWIAEMSEGLPRGEEDPVRGGESGGKEDSENVTVTNKAKIERKTKQKRRKEWKAKLATIKKQKDKEDRIRNSDVFKIKSIQKELDENEKLTKMRIRSRQAFKLNKKSKPRRLGKLSFKEEDVAVKLGDELRNSLRLCTPSVELIEERFKSFQRRNILETRVKQKMKRKHKLRTQVKRSYREAIAEIDTWDDLE